MAHQALRSILAALDWPAEQAEQVTIDGQDPVLAAPFRLGTAATAAVAASGLAAAALWTLRGGRHQRVSVNLRQAAASMRSSSYVQRVGAPPAVDRDPIMGFYPARAGRFAYVHTNFPNHRAAALGVLGVEAERAQVRRAVAGRDALELEEAIIAAGGAGGMVRSAAEWAAHPQGQAVAGLPLLEVTRIGEAAPRPLPGAARPLDGVRVLDLTRVLAGPSAARTLAEHGAEVLRITAAHLPSIEYQEQDTGHGKRSARLDLRDAAALATLRELLAGADVFVQGYRPGTLAARGLAPEALAALRPGIVCVSLSAFSHVGPWAERRGFDTVIQTVSGIAARQGECFPGAEPGPQFYPASAIDYLTGYLLAFGTMVALERRAREGGSWLVRSSLAQIGHWLQGLGELPVHAGAPPAGLTSEEIKRWSIESDTPYGRLRHLGPVVGLPETPPRWARPSVPLGHDAPRWPAHGE